MTIHKLWVQGYRSIKDVALKLNSVNVIVGSNGTGKSNLYRALHLLSRAADGELAKAIAEEGGMPSALWAGRRHKSERAQMRISIWVDHLLQFLCLLAALLSTRPPQMVALNEPESSIHPDLFRPLARLICEASRVSQVWVTTQSLELTDYISEEAGAMPIELRKVDGATKVSRQDLDGSIRDEDDEDEDDQGDQDFDDAQDEED